MKKSWVPCLFLPLALLTACDRKTEWTETWPLMSYSFDDPKHSYVGLSCIGIPVLALVGGDWPANARRFTLNIDGVGHEIGIFRGQHGRAMIIDDPKIVASFTGAKREITFRVGKNWAKSVPPNPRLEDARQRCLSRSAQA